MIRRDFIRLTSLTAGSLPLSKFSRAIGSRAIRHYPPEGTEDIYTLFLDPGNRYRPFVRWWWNGDRLSGDEILRELDVLKDAGIGGVEINPIKFPDEADPVDTKPLTWLSDEWISMLEIALRGARQKGMICDMIVGSGWPYGGEFLTREEQTQMIALGTRNVTGGGSVNLTKKELLDSVSPAFASGYHDPLKELVGLKLVPAELQDLSQVLNLDDRLSQDNLIVDVPAGDHVLYYLVKITGFMAVINGAPGASGPVLNHYNQAAVEKYLNRLSDKLTARLGPLGGYFRAFFTDSIELEGANWCADFYEQFRQRRGYDLAPWFPFILFKVGEMGNAVSGEYGARFAPGLKEKIEWVRYDFETTKRALFQERFIRTFADWCTRNGVQSRMQAYGMDCDPIASGMMVDIPECETWIWSEELLDFGTGDYNRGRSYTMINKFVSSSAHLSGKKLISCEEMTNTGDPFHASLDRIKQAGDQSMLSGVTHSILHGFNYSPLETPFPGWVRYGTFFNERNTWWPYFRRWTDYKARLSVLFQHSVMQADIAVLHPLADMAAKYGFQRDPFPRLAYPPYVHKIWEVIHQNGSGCDYVSEEILNGSVIRDGGLVYKDRYYKALLLLEVESMRPATAKVLKKFAAAGGKVIFVGKAPHLSDGLVDHNRESKEVDGLIRSLLAAHPRTTGLVPVDEKDLLNWFRNLQQQFSLDPAVRISHPTDFISQLHYRSGDKDFFFFINYGPARSNTFEAVFNTGDRTAWLWNPETGERSLYPAGPSKNTLTLSLGPSESRLIAFDTLSEGEKPVLSALALAVRNGTAKETALKGPWDLTLNHVDGVTESRVLKDLVDFSQQEELRSFAGIITYRNRFHVDQPGHPVWLDLGSIRCVSEVEVNGRPQGVRWYGDHLYDISDALIAGDNYLTIRLVTTLGNYMKTLKHNRAADAWTSGTPFYPMGLIKPVRLLSIS
ncbi:MAG: glycosyl hydrolase [Puia sp.]|nr:glycosyl hydrolase [Puia sp.]